MDFSVCCSFSWLLMTCIETSCCMKAGNQSSISRFEQQPQKTQICTSHRRVKVRLRLHVIPTPCSFMWDDKLWFLCLSSYSEASRFVWSLQRHSRNTCYPPFVSNNAAAGWNIMGRRWGGSDLSRWEWVMKSTETNSWLQLSQDLCETSQGYSVCLSQGVNIINLCSVETQGETVRWWSKILSFDTRRVETRSHWS